MPILIGIVVVIAALYLFGFIMGTDSKLGDLFNIVFEIIRKAWVVLVIIVIMVILFNVF